MNLDVDLGIESLFELINKLIYNYIDIEKNQRRPGRRKKTWRF